jgi:hypothetical protein
MIAILLSIALGQGRLTGPAVVRLTRDASGFHLQRNGRDYFIKGAGAQKQLAELAAAGGNSIRTWGVDDATPALLDECAKNGLTATVGFWLLKVGDHGFSYLDAERVRRQADDVLAGVRKLKDHPSVLLWSVGNEVELGLPKDQEEAYWKHVDDLAERIHKIDPGRPVMTVVADMWPEKMAALLKFCPHLDLLGVNSYDGLPTLSERMKLWTRPYVVTEFQHRFSQTGTPATLGLASEPSSTEKARSCAELYSKAVLAFPGRVLGSYVFYWDRSTTQESSFYNMHLRTGERLQACDEMQFLWSGKRPKNRCPEIVRVDATANDGRHWSLIAKDPDGDPLTYELQVVNEDKPRFVGDFEQDLGVDFQSNVSSAFELPANLKSGRYRAYVVVRNGKGGAAVWNTVYKLPD